MRRLNAEHVIARAELEQLMADYWREIDLNEGRNAAVFFTEDCTAIFGAIAFSGRAGVTKYYAERAQRVRAEHSEGVRTSRHVYLNLRIVLEHDDLAKLEFLIATFAGAGKPPILGGCTPIAISDSRFKCRREPSGEWRIFEFSGTPLFIEDPFARKSLLGS